MTLANLAVEQVQVLNPRHARFVSEYASTGNGTRSYKAVYGEALSDEAAAASASRLLHSVRVRAALDAIKAQAAVGAEVRAERILRQLSLIAFLPLHVVLEFPGLLGPQLRAIELLMRHLGMFDRREQKPEDSIAEQLQKALERVRRLNCGESIAGSDTAPPPVADA